MEQILCRARFTTELIANSFLQNKSKKNTLELIILIIWKDWNEKAGKGIEKDGGIFFYPILLITKEKENEKRKFQDP